MRDVAPVDDFARDGFLVLPDFVSAASCDALMARSAELVATHAPETISIFSTHEQSRRSDEYFLESGGEIRCFFEEDGRSINKIGHAMHDRDPVFERFSRQPKLAELVSTLGIAEPLLLQSMYIFKQPHVGGEVTPHTDHTFLWTDPPSVMGLWFALEDATVENGCMYAIPGSHREPARKRFHRDDRGGTTFEVLDPTPHSLVGEVPLEAKKGTCIVLHGLLVHRSGANTSARSRHAYSVHVIDARASYRADNWLRRSAPFRGF